jgi:FixJ family two-component response regulator
MYKPEILIIDDSVEIGEALSVILENLDYSTRYFSNPIEAISYFESEMNSVVFLDINLPGKSGLELLPMFKKISPKTQIIMITGERDINSIISSLSNKASDFLLKPFSIESVESSLNRAIEYYNLMKERENYQEALERDIKFGSRIQRQIIFPPRQDPNLIIDYYPVSFLSGHFYNIIDINETQKMIVYGNVEGSGVGSGFIGLYATTLAKDIIQQNESPAKILSHINKEIYFKLNIHTLTMLCLLIDSQRKVISYSLGGLPEPILFSKKDKTVNYLSSESLIILGVTPESNFENQEILFDKEDILFIFNNAFFNSRNPDLRESFENLKISLLDTMKKEGRNTFKDCHDQIKKYLQNPRNKTAITRDLSFILYEL